MHRALVIPDGLVQKIFLPTDHPQIEIAPCVRRIHRNGDVQRFQSLRPFPKAPIAQSEIDLRRHQTGNQRKGLFVLRSGSVVLALAIVCYSKIVMHPRILGKFLQKRLILLDGRPELLLLSMFVRPAEIPLRGFTRTAADQKSDPDQGDESAPMSIPTSNHPDLLSANQPLPFWMLTKMRKNIV